MSLTDRQIAALVRDAEQAEREIAKAINDALQIGRQTEYLYSMQGNVRSILDRFSGQVKAWATDEKQGIRLIYSDALRAVDADLKAKGIPLAAGFGAVHETTALAYGQAVMNAMEGMAQTVFRQTADVYQRLTIAQARGVAYGYNDWGSASRMLRLRLSSEGVTGFVDRAGRRWGMKRYTEMAVTTSAMNAVNDATQNRLLDHDIDLVKISTHTGSCRLCFKWQGKVLSLTGRTPGYPTLQEAKTWDNGRGLYHVGCRHSMGGFVPEIEGYSGLPGDEGAGTDSIQKRLEKAHPGVTFDLKDIHPEIAQTIADEYTRLASEYPEAAARVKYMGTRGTFGQNEVAHIVRDEFGINPALAADPAKLRAALKQNPGWLVDDSLESIIDHEYGHLVFDWARHVPRGGREAEMWAMNSYKTQSLPSVYGGRSFSEAWAEGFAAIQRGKKALPYVQMQAEILDALKTNTSAGMNTIGRLLMKVKQ